MAHDWSSDLSSNLSRSRSSNLQNPSSSVAKTRSVSGGGGCYRLLCRCGGGDDRFAVESMGVDTGGNLPCATTAAAAATIIRTQCVSQSRYVRRRPVCRVCTVIVPHVVVVVVTRVRVTYFIVSSGTTCLSYAFFFFCVPVVLRFRHRARVSSVHRRPLPTGVVISKKKILLVLVSL